MERLITRWLCRKRKTKMEILHYPVLLIFSFFKTIITPVLAACFVITSDPHSLYQHKTLSILRKQHLRSRVGEDLLLETSTNTHSDPGTDQHSKKSLLSLLTFSLSDFITTPSLSPQHTHTHMIQGRVHTVFWVGFIH